MIVRSVRLITIMYGKRNYVILISSDVKNYSQECDALGVDNKEMSYVYCQDLRKTVKLLTIVKSV